MKKNPLQPVALIVTSDSTTAAFLQRVLRLTFQLIERDVHDAQETLHTASIDLVLLDSKGLKEEELFLALSRFRSSLGKKKTPILLITSNLKKKFAQDALRAGATDFINEPLDEDEIEQRIAVAFQSFERTKNISEVAKRSTSGAQTTATSSLANRQFLNDQAIKEISKARQNEGHVSLLIVELDVKKPATPTEEMHLHLMSLLQSTLRKNDILIPQSTGKFIIMLPKTSERAAELMAESIRTDVETKISPLSVSIGLITWDHSRPAVNSAAEEFDHLIEVATQAVQEAKKTGNRIITSESQ